MVLVIISRLRRGQSIYIGGHDHTYHRLLNLGLNPNRAVLTMQIAALALGCLAVVLLTQPPPVTIIVFASLILIGAVLLLVLEKKFES
jgi:hypothetical protein